MSTETKHTAGPWMVQDQPHACFHEGNRYAITQSGEDQGESWYQTIAEVWPAEDGSDAADARLIASAPELLEALRDLRATVYEHHPITYSDLIEQADAAIAKATNTGAQ